MTKSKQLAIGGLLLFVVGALLVPALHGLELACADDGATKNACHSCCPHEHAPDHNTTDGPEDSRPSEKPHDPCSCAICQLANTPVSVAATVMALPSIELVEIALPVAPQSPDFKTPRLLPFPCGPPA
jgi:hypothetical protein